MNLPTSFGHVFKIGILSKEGESEIQSSWLTNGVGMAQLALQFGADDFGGTLIGEEVVSCTGSRSTELTGQRIIDAIRQIGYQPEERDNFYNAVSLH